MANVEEVVAEHYTTGLLTERVKDALRAIGVDPATATASDLKAGDEFHTGGLQASDHLFDRLTINADMSVLDVGCGIGGTSRLIADRFGARVTGIDLTPEFVETAVALTEMVRLGHLAQFRQGSALSMPVPSGSFDLAVLMHVGMNIGDKVALLSEISRCLKPGATFALFDVMRGVDPEPLAFPLPWSSMAETSFVDPPSLYKLAAQAADLVLTHEEDRSAFAKEFFAKALAKAAEGPQPLGIHLMMGETAPLKFENYVANLDAGRIAPVEMIFRKEG
ncbi:MAG: methyltransferase domain-containing protein [Pseudomonadota bacterium]